MKIFCVNYSERQQTLNITLVTLWFEYMSVQTGPIEQSWQIVNVTSGFIIDSSYLGLTGF